MDEAVFEAAAGSMSTEGAITILTGNPTRRQGFFFDTHNRLADFWRHVKVSCFDSSRVAASFIESEKQFGEESNRYRVRVLGEFPLADDDTLIPYFLIEEAAKRDISAELSQDVFGGWTWRAACRATEVLWQSEEATCCWRRSRLGA